MPSDAFLNALGPSLAAYGNGQDPNIPQGLIPGVVNTGMPPQAPAPAGPPPASPPVAAAPAGPPPPPQAPAVATAPAAQAPPPPVPQRAPVLVTQGAGTPAHEALTRGPTALKLENQAAQEREGGVKAGGEAERTGYLNQAMAASVAQDEAQKRAQQGLDMMAEHQRRENEANEAVRQASQNQQHIPITDYWSDRSTFQHVGAAIAVALGGFGAALTGGQNTAAQLLQADMDRDLKVKQMRSEKQEEANKGKIDAAQQYYNNLVKTYGQSPAADLFAAGQRDKAAAMVQEQAAQMGLAKNDANTLRMIGDLQAQADEKRASAVKQIAATGGEERYFDPELGVWQTRKEREEYMTKGVLEGRAQENQRDIAATKGQREGQHQGAKFIAEQYQHAGIPGIESAIDEASKLLKPGAKGKAANTKGISAPALSLWNGGIPGLPTQAGKFAYRKLYGDEAAEREQSWDIAKDRLAKEMVGRLTPAMYDRINGALNGASTPEARQHALDLARNTLEAQKRTIRAGAGPESAAAFDQNLQTANPEPIDEEPVR